MIELTNTLQDKSPKSFVNFLQPFPPSNIKYNTLNHLLGSDTKGWGILVCIMQLCEYMAVNNRTVKEIFLTIIKIYTRYLRDKPNEFKVPIESRLRC